MEPGWSDVEPRWPAHQRAGTTASPSRPRAAPERTRRVSRPAPPRPRCHCGLRTRHRREHLGELSAAPNTEPEPLRRRGAWHLVGSPACTDQGEVHAWDTHARQARTVPAQPAPSLARGAQPHGRTIPAVPEVREGRPRAVGSSARGTPLLTTSFGSLDLHGTGFTQGWPEFPEAIAFTSQHLQDASDTDRAWSMQFCHLSGRHPPLGVPRQPRNGRKERRQRPLLPLRSAREGLGHGSGWRPSRTVLAS